MQAKLGKLEIFVILNIWLEIFCLSFKNMAIQGVYCYPSQSQVVAKQTEGTLD